MNPIAQMIINSVISQVSNSNPQQAQLIRSVATMFLQPQAGGQNGLAAIVQQFQSSGLDDAMASWIGTGANKAVTAEQIQQAMPAEQIQQVAAAANLPAEQAPNLLAQILPELINQITPNGKIDDQLVNQVLNAFLNNKTAA